MSLVAGSGYNAAVAEPSDEFPNNYVGDLVPTERGWVVVPPTCCPDGHDYNDPGWSVSLGVVHMQWPAYGVALLVRQIDLLTAARAALPNPRQRPGVSAST